MKTICIYHKRDLDGWMSGAIVKKWFEETNKNSEVLNLTQHNKLHWENSPKETKNHYNTLWMLGWDYGDNIPDLSGYDKVIMCDVSFPTLEMGSIPAELIWIDHHKSAIDEVDKYLKDNSGHFDGLRDIKFAACELTWVYFFPSESMPEIVRLLGRYDCFGHKFTKENQDRLDTLLDCEYNDTGNLQVLPYQNELEVLKKKQNEEQKVLEFQYGARQAISNYEEAFDYLTQSLNYALNIEYWTKRGDSVETEILTNGKIIYKYLCTEAKQTYKKAFPIELSYRPSIEDDTEYYKFLCINEERLNPINFGIDYHKDGYEGFACFWYKEGKWVFSLYNDDGNIDCSVIAKQYGGGGHKGSAGFIIDDLKQIIK